VPGKPNKVGIVRVSLRRARFDRDRIQGITVRKNVAALRTSLQAILDNRDDEMSLRMRKLILGLQQDWIWIDKRIEMTTSEIETVSKSEASCQRLMTIPGIGPIISTAVVAAVGNGEAYDRGRDFAAWLGLVPRQHSTGGRTILGRITKRGSRYLRMLFVQAAQVIMMRPKNWHKFSFGRACSTTNSGWHWQTSWPASHGASLTPAKTLIGKKRNWRLRSDHSRTRRS